MKINTHTCKNLSIYYIKRMGFIILLLYIFHSCSSNNDVVIQTNNINGLIIDTANYQYLKYEKLDLTTDFWRTKRSVELDLNGDELSDIIFEFIHSSCVSCGTSKWTNLFVTNPNVQIHAFTKIDTFIKYVVHDTINQRFCRYDYEFQADRHSDLDSITSFEYVEHAYPYLLNMNDTLLLEDNFITVDTLIWEESNGSSTDFADYCYYHGRYLGYKDRVNQRSFIGYRLVGESTILGYIDFTISYDESEVHGVAYRRFD